jgi:glycosyltransferase involved in cell wall biosynthesis
VNVRTVCFFTETSAFGGAEQALLNVLGELDRSHWRPMLSFHESEGVAGFVDRAQELGVELWPVRPLPEGPRGALRATAFAARLRRRRPDVFHAHLTWQGGCKYALAAAVATRVPAVVASYQLLVDARLTRPTVLQQRMLARTVGHAIVVSRELESYLRERFGWPADKIRLIHNAVPFDQPLPVDTALRAELSPDGKPIVLTPARLDPFKGHRFLLEAARSLPDVRFVFAGAGGERVSLERAAAEAGVASRVTFLGHRDDVPQLLACADAVVLPSLAEGFPLAILEAMTASRPVIATTVGDVADAILPGETGLLVEPGNPGALAAAISAVLADPELAERLGASARSYVGQHFRVSQMVARVTSVYDELLERRPDERRH